MQKLNFITAGESHGKQLNGILEGIPSGLEITEDEITSDLKRRQLGFGRSRRMKIESDRAEITSGVRFGKTLGSPIALTITNRDWDNWKKKMAIEKVRTTPEAVTIPRPGHADLAGVMKHGFDDIRNVLERSSARETTMRVGLGSICRKLLQTVGIAVGSRVIRIHHVQDTVTIPETLSPQDLNTRADASPVRCLDPSAEEKMISVIENAKERGDSVGGVFEVIAKGLPFGLGSYTHWDKKLQSSIGAAIMSINAIKGIEIGKGFESAMQFGSKIHDEIIYTDGKYHRSTNNAGGIEGGMSNTQPIIVRAVMKPIPTLTRPLQSVDMKSKEPRSAHKERSDTCAVPAASVIAESMLCMVLADALLEKFGGDSVKQLKAHMKASAQF
ncbi:MAG: chorismate synthase [Candidatus Neomarinimicrobiota bacterium]